jgi:hypothetical protein
MEEGIVRRMGGLPLLQGVDGKVEVEPFADAEVEFSGAFQLFEGEEVLPVG